ncbi:MAG TPA: prephenate dehydratase [Bryobacteraceae bacterium]|jgi:prephenate dehydratase
MKVAFQGELGAFSQEAIRQLLGQSAQPVPCQRFDDVFEALETRRVAAAVTPIENTLHGSVHQNYDLLLKHDFTITAETNVRIVHNLIAAPGTRFRQITKAYSHDVALNQCLDFFRRNKQIDSVPFYDTAGSVKMVMKDRPPGAAAIASKLAAKTYGGQILKSEIEDDRQNYTRFFLLERRGAKPRNPKGSSRKPWKTSLVFSTRNVPGALFRALSALALRELDLTKLESRPLRGRPWEYMFYLDLIGRQSDPAVVRALAHLGEVADFLRVLGSYRAA